MRCTHGQLPLPQQCLRSDISMECQLTISFAPFKNHPTHTQSTSPPMPSLQNRVLSRLRGYGHLEALKQEAESTSLVAARGILRLCQSRIAVIALVFAVIICQATGYGCFARDVKLGEAFFWGSLALLVLTVILIQLRSGSETSIDTFTSSQSKTDRTDIRGNQSRLSRVAVWIHCRKGTLLTPSSNCSSVG